MEWKLKGKKKIMTTSNIEFYTAKIKLVTTIIF